MSTTAKTEAPERTALRILTPDLVLEHLSQIIEHSHDAIFSTDLNGVVLSWNAAATAVYGYTAEEMIGGNIERVLPADRKREIADVIERIRSGESVGPYETKRLRKGGKIIDVQLTISPVRDIDHRLVGVSVIARDVTERLAAQRELARKQRELEDFFENAVVGLHWVGADGTILWANRAEMESLGYTAEEYIGHHIREFHADSDVICDILQRLTNNEKLHGYEARLRCKDGSIRHVLISSSVLWEDGKFVHTRCFTVDVTERKLAEEALRRTEKMATAGRLAASMAHEINNPLSSVMNLVYLAKSTAIRPDVIEFLSGAENELRRVSNIAKRNLGFFREQRSAEKVSLKRIVEDVVDIYRGQLKARQVSVAIDAREACVWGKEDDLRQVVSNVLLNAIDASTGPNTVSIRVRQTGSRVVLTVHDRGEGIARANRGRIFEPFFTTKANTGTGLGLWVSHQIVCQHRGRIRFKSRTAPGRSGTSFRITLPAYSATAGEQ